MPRTISTVIETAVAEVETVPAPVVGIRTVLAAMVLSDVHNSAAFATGGRSPRHLVEHARTQIGDVISTLRTIARDCPPADPNRDVLETLIAKLA